MGGRMHPIAFKKVWIENKIANHYKTQHILSKLGNIEIDYFDDDLDKHILRNADIHLASCFFIHNLYPPLYEFILS